MDVWLSPTISHVKILNHPIETTIKNWLFGVPGGALLSETERVTYSFSHNHGSLENYPK